MAMHLGNSAKIVLKQHKLTQADNINITFHNKSTKAFFSTDTLSYDFSYGEMEFNFEVDMYNDSDIYALLFLHEKVNGEETKIVIELGSAQNCYKNKGIFWKNILKNNQH